MGTNITWIARIGERLVRKGAAGLSALALIWLSSPALALDPTLPRPGGKAPPPPAPVFTPVAPTPLNTAPPEAPATGPAVARAADAPPPAAPATRQAIPDAAAVQQANRLIDQLFRDRAAAAAKTPELK